MGPGEVFIALVLGVTILGYVFFTARHRERMSMIDKGVAPSIFTSRNRSSTFFTLKLGMLAIGVSLGIIVTMILVQTFDFPADEPVAIAMILLFGGASLVANYLVERKVDAQNKEEE